ncbi:ABC transporter permease [Devosia sp. 2618]|uniref:ABC transporter permease n=1 Tax=Devosia sp. 2618 TaxID=3156454 RepID=UPI00339ABB6B
MTSRLSKTLMLVAVIAILAFLLAPILVLIFSAFDGGNIFRFPPRSYSLRWFEAAFNHSEYRSSLWVSTILGLIATFIAVTLASFAAFGLVRGRPAYRLGMEVLLLAPLTLPLVVWAIALLSIYAELGMNGTLPGLILAHVTITIPFAARIMIATFDEIDPNLEAAAKSLGASPFHVMRRVTLPLAMPGLLSSTAIAFLVSFNDVVVTTLIAGAGWITFPVRTFSRLRTEGIDPTTIAIGAMIVAFTIVVIVVGQRLFQLSRRF